VARASISWDQKSLMRTPRSSMSLTGKPPLKDDLTFIAEDTSRVRFAFPKECKARESEFPGIQKFYENMKEEKGVKEYLSSGRRLEYSNGIFRHYPELDRQE
jgi:hypothetical protein